MTFIKHFWRQIQADKSFSVMTLAGLTVAITCSLIIFTYVSYHYSFNQFHENSDRIYRFLTVDTSQPDGAPAGMTSNALIPAVRAEIPEIELATRFQFSLSITIRLNDRVHYLDQALLADPDFFQMFNFPLIAGVSGEALSEPNTVVLSQSFARQLFGDQDAIGKVINIFNSRDMRIVGVIEDMPANSHIQADLIMALLPDPAWPAEMAARYESWRDISMQSYVRLYPDSDPLVVERKVLTLIEEREESGYISAIMQPLEDIHLHSQQVQNEVNAGKEDARQMYLLIGIAILLMTIAVCNFVNLSTAKGVTRAKEVGIRKTVGASRRQLIFQYLAESVVLMAIATMLSLVLMELISPWITIPTIDNQLGYLFGNSTQVLIAIAILAAAAIVAGIYPALVLSSQKTILGLKGNYAKSRKGIFVRKSLVVVQIAISTTVIIALLVINAQIGFLQTRSLGFDTQNVVYLDLVEQSMFGGYDAFANEMAAIPEVASFTNSSFLPGGLWGKFGYQPQEGSQTSTEFLTNTVTVDATFFQTMQINLLEGESCSATMTGSDNRPVILNQAAAHGFEWADSPVGKILRGVSGTYYRVAGVVADTRLRGPQYAAEPFVFHCSTEPTWSVVVRMNPENMAAGLAKIESAWQRIYPEHPFSYAPLSDVVEGLLGEEVEFSSQLFEFTFIAMFIACLGLYGHATFSANQSSKGMGIRKVFGASDRDIFRLVLREYGALLFIANVIAWPLGFILVNNWLSNFADRIDIEASYFLQGFLIVAALGLLTISTKIWRTIRTNPVETLRYE